MRQRYQVRCQCYSPNEKQENLEESYRDREQYMDLNYICKNINHQTTWQWMGVEGNGNVKDNFYIFDLSNQGNEDVIH